MLNLRFALRSLRRTPLVTAVAVLSLALGIGANGAIFSFFEEMLLRPLPVEAPEELVNLSNPGSKSGSMSSNNAGGVDDIWSYPMFRDLQREQTGLVGIAAHRSFGANLAYAGEAFSAEGMYVSGSYFPLLGLRPTAGRLFEPGDDVEPGGHPLAVLSHDFWRERFNADPTVLNRSLVVNGLPLTIVGVAPRGFRGTTAGQDPSIFVPISMRAALTPYFDGLENRMSYWAYLFGRLEPGVSLEQAQAALNAVYRPIIQEVELPLQTSSSEQYLERFAEKELTLSPGARGQSEFHREASTPLILLFCVSGIVLLIACANVANLLLTKASARTGELAVRLSIGARRRQLVGQMLTEALLLSLAGGLLGLLVARGTLLLIVSLMPAREQGSPFDLQLGPITWAFMAGLSLLTVLAGLFPAWNATRESLAMALRGMSGRDSGSRSAGRFRSVMAVAQIALAMTLLISAGLFARSLYNVSRVDLGIQIDRLATFSLSPELSGHDSAQSRALFERLETELGALPEVRAAVVSMVPLIAGSNWGTNVTVEGFTTDPDADTHSSYNEVGPGYFRTLGVPLIAGREFEERDVLGAPKVAVVNEAFSKKFELGRDAVGKRMRVGGGEDVELDIEIVGLVQDSKYSEVKDEVPPLFFLPYRQDENIGSASILVRAEGDPESLLPTLRRRASQIAPNLPIENLKTMELQVQESVFVDRMITTLSTAFAVLATVLAAIGLYGVLAYVVSQRTREIGLRSALGADAARVRWLILRQVVVLGVPGALLGIAVAVALGRGARSILFELEGHDPAVIVAAVVLLAAITFCAGLIPAQRAARIDPMRALREE